MKKGISIALLTAVCLLGILPLSVGAKTANVFVEPVVAITRDTRYSNSSGGYVSNNDYLTITMPVPYDSSRGMTVEFTSPLGVYTTQYYLTEQFTTISSANVPTGDINGFALPSQSIPEGAYFVVINVLAESFVENVGFVINGDPVDEAYGDYTLAVRGHYETIEVDDSMGVVNDVLTMWQHGISALVAYMNPMYSKMAGIVSLLLGVPVCIAVVSIIFRRR